MGYAYLSLQKAATPVPKRHPNTCVTASTSRDAGGGYWLMFAGPRHPEASRHEEAVERTSAEAATLYPGPRGLGWPGTDDKARGYGAALGHSAECLADPECFVDSRLEGAHRPRRGDILLKVGAKDNSRGAARVL